MKKQNESVASATTKNANANANANASAKIEINAKSIAAEKAKRTRAEISAAAEQRKELQNLTHGAVKYNERMRISKIELFSISRLFKNLCEVYGDTLNGVKFANFVAYMRERYHMGESDKNTPKRGWSGHYACQFAEKYIKMAAADQNNEAHSAAVAYLRNERAEKQNAKNCIF